MLRNVTALLEQFQRLFGERVKDRRRELRFTQIELAGRVGMSRAALANIEVGNQRTSVFLLARLASALNTAPGDLIPDLKDAKLKLKQTRQTPLPAKSKPKLMILELKNLNISVEPKSNVESALKEIQNQSKK